MHISLYILHACMKCVSTIYEQILGMKCIVKIHIKMLNCWYSKRSTYFFRMPSFYWWGRSTGNSVSHMVDSSSLDTLVCEWLGPRGRCYTCPGVIIVQSIRAIFNSQAPATKIKKIIYIAYSTDRIILANIYFFAKIQSIVQKYWLNNYEW